MNVSVVIPTYNEYKNIPILFEKIFNVFKKNKINGEIIVVDDNSEDGTSKVVKNYTKNHAVQLIIRKDEKGLASACLKGFDYSNGEVIIVMDADLQHPPEKIPELIEAINNGADIAIGSRYIKGGSLGGWSASREIISKSAGVLANLLFDNIKDIKDKESGFFAFKKKVIQGVNLNPIGYKILLEILILGKYKVVKEVGYIFGKRTKGESKLGFNIIFYYVSHLIRLLWVTGKIQKLLKFCFVGFLGVFVNIGILYFLTTIGLHYLISGAISIEASLLFNFFLNRAWTFSKEARSVNLKIALIKDHTTRFIGILINYAALYIFTEVFHVYFIVSMIIGIIFSMVWNFLGNIKWVWIDKK